MNDANKLLARSGWLLLIGGILGACGIGAYALLFDAETPWLVKAVFVAVYGGLALLLLSALWQRLVERKTDKYEDVKL